MAPFGRNFGGVYLIIGNQGAAMSL